MDSPAGALLFIAALLGWGGAGLLNYLADKFIGGRACRRCGWEYAPRWPALVVYAWRRGRCPECGASLALRPPLVELATMLLFALAAFRFGATMQAVVVAGYLAVLLLIAVVDLAVRRIPNIVVLPASAVALGLSVAGAYPGWKRSLGGGAIAFGVFLLAYGLGGLFLRIVNRRAAASGPALGAGDVKLALFIGLATGYPAVVLAILVGTLSGALVALGWIIVQAARRRYQPFADMAYGPYLALGATVALLWGGAFISR